MKDENETWQELTFYLIPGSQIDIEEAGAELMELGAAGSELLSRDAVKAFFRSEVRARLAIGEAEKLGLRCGLMQPLQDENWTLKCAEMLTPITVGDVTIRPVVAAGQEGSPEKDEISIIPGLGFGTGHHESTRLALRLLQHPALAGRPIRRCLDVGTGSGILALAATRLYHCMVEAIDIDADALINARENISLNGLADKVYLHTGDITSAHGSCDLLLANLYCQILLTQEPLFHAGLSGGGFLILAGFQRDELQQVAAAYSEERWSKVACEEEHGWSSLLLQKADADVH